MPVKMKPNSVIIAELGLEPNGRVHKYFTKRCADYMDKYVPRRLGTIGGTLRETVTITTDEIIYSAPYAKIQYDGIIWGKLVPEDHYSTPGTGHHWDERMKSAEMPKLVQDVEDHFLRGK